MLTDWRHFAKVVVPDLPDSKEWNAKASKYGMDGLVNPAHEEDPANHPKYILQPGGEATAAEIWTYLMRDEYMARLDKK